ncbi:hypothetical protein SBA2_840015 [Acidobacteriia bacterium SbA2]|nr:hypothetical protein SBA2_840015 [Acidobacteriia bacterium SbA2]
MQADPVPDQFGLSGGDVVGFQFPLRQDRELILRVQMLAVGTAAVGPATAAAALHERTRKHFAQSAQTADEAAAQLQFGIRTHKSSLFHLTLIIMSD